MTALEKEPDRRYDSAAAMVLRSGELLGRYRKMMADAPDDPAWALERIYLSYPGTAEGDDGVRAEAETILADLAPQLGGENAKLFSGFAAANERFKRYRQ